MSVIASMLAVVETATEHEKSEVPFFIAGGLWAAFAVAISVVGFTRPDFPTSPVAARGVMTAGGVLMVAAVSMAIYVAL
ncbi:MAG: hypothetical protein QOG15_146 [Solirubrobacteraceae bacterium]|jgi:hypothetical protein|nr:hypothetical protein [Solirubrobacteraceae bacterium]